MNQERIKTFIMPALAAIMIVTLPALAYLQYKWIGDLSEREKEHLKNFMETSGFQYAMKINRSLANMRNYFYFDDSPVSADSLKSRLQKKLVGWKMKSSGNLLENIYIADSAGAGDLFGVVENKYISPKSAGIDSLILRSYFTEENANRPPGQSNFVYNKFGFLIVPINSERKSAIVLKLNRKFIFENLLTKEIYNFFPVADNEFIIAFADGKDSSIVFINNKNFSAKGAHWSDVALPYGFLPPVGSPEMDSLFEQKIRRFQRNPNGNFRFMHRNGPNGERLEPPMQLLIGLKEGSINNEIAAFRAKNLIISFSILSVLALASFIMIGISARSRKLARQQTQFIAYLPHELRTPLAVIKTASENISDGLISDSSKFQQYGAVIKNEVDKLWEMIENSLMFAGLNSDKASNGPSFTDVAETAAGALAGLNGVLSNRKVNVELPPDLPYAYGNPTMLSVAIRNLISNAAKFSPDGGEIIISAKYDAPHDTISVSVRDFGCGINSRDMKRIFEPFFRSPYALEGNIPGNGIGLALVKRIAELYGGRIEAESKPGRGSEFRLILRTKKNGI